MMNIPNDRQRAALLRIAAAITGSADETNANGDRIAGALERIASYLEQNPLVTGASLPEVTADNNGAVLKVENGAWRIGVDEKGDTLPTVTAEDAGKVLGVTDAGEWAAIAPAEEEPSNPAEEPNEP